MIRRAVPMHSSLFEEDEEEEDFLLLLPLLAA